MVQPQQARERAASSTSRPYWAIDETRRYLADSTPQGLFPQDMDNNQEVRPDHLQACFLLDLSELVSFPRIYTMLTELPN